MFFNISWSKLDWEGVGWNDNELPEALHRVQWRFRDPRLAEMFLHRLKSGCECLHQNPSETVRRKRYIKCKMIKKLAFIHWPPHQDAETSWWTASTRGLTTARSRRRASSRSARPRRPSPWLPPRCCRTPAPAPGVSSSGTTASWSTGTRTLTCAASTVSTENTAMCNVTVNICCDKGAFDEVLLINL